MNYSARNPMLPCASRVASRILLLAISKVTSDLCLNSTAVSPGNHYIKQPPKNMISHNAIPRSNHIFQRLPAPLSLMFNNSRLGSCSTKRTTRSMTINEWKIPNHFECWCLPSPSAQFSTTHGAGVLGCGVTPSRLQTSCKEMHHGLQTLEAMYIQND